MYDFIGVEGETDVKHRVTGPQVVCSSGCGGFNCGCGGGVCGSSSTSVGPTAGYEFCVCDAQDLLLKLSSY